MNSNNFFLPCSDNLAHQHFRIKVLFISCVFQQLIPRYYLPLLLITSVQWSGPQDYWSVVKAKLHLPQNRKSSLQCDRWQGEAALQLADTLLMEPQNNFRHDQQSCLATILTNLYGFTTQHFSCGKPPPSTEGLWTIIVSSEVATTAYSSVKLPIFLKYTQRSFPGKLGCVSSFRIYWDLSMCQDKRQRYLSSFKGE